MTTLQSRRLIVDPQTIQSQGWIRSPISFLNFRLQKSFFFLKNHSLVLGNWPTGFHEGRIYTRPMVIQYVLIYVSWYSLISILVLLPKRVLSSNHSGRRRSQNWSTLVHTGHVVVFNEYPCWYRSSRHSRWPSSHCIVKIIYCHTASYQVICIVGMCFSIKICTEMQRYTDMTITTLWHC